MRHAQLAAIGLALLTLPVLACSASTGEPDEGAAGTESSAIAVKGPVLPDCILTHTCCGSAGEAACTSGAPCESGSTDLGGACVACTSLQPTASVKAQTVYDPDADNQAVVTWSTTPGASGVVITVSDHTNPAFQEIRTLYGASGTATFPGLALGDDYTVNVTAFGANSNYCPPGWTSQPFSFKNECVTYVTPELKPANGQGWANLKLCNDGSWTYWGEVDDTGAFGVGYALTMDLQWQDTTGVYPFNFVQTGSLDGWAVLNPTKTKTFSQSGTSEILALNWGPITAAPYHYDLSVDTSVGGAIGDVLMWTVDALGAVDIAVCCATGSGSPYSTAPCGC